MIKHLWRFKPTVTKRKVKRNKEWGAKYKGNHNKKSNNKKSNNKLLILVKA